MVQGRKPKPTGTKKRTGNPGKRPLNDREPQYESGVPACPKWLSKDAKAVWKSLGPKLAERGLLTEADAAVFTTYCETYARYKAACAGITKEGLLRDGRKSPYVLIVETAAKQLVSIAAEFGLSPSSRSRVKASGGPTTVDPLTEILTRRGNLNN